jgi:ribonuclease HII
MAWIIGIDEAGYGPNLGPFVMTSVALRVPDECAGADLWRMLAAAVRRAADPHDGRVVVDDSKVVYSRMRGLAALEHAVYAALWRGPAGARLSRLLEWICPDCLDELGAEAWFTGTSEMPARADPLAVVLDAARFDGVCAEHGVCRGEVRAVTVCTPRFNTLTDSNSSKGAVLADGLGRLLRYHRDRAPGTEALSFFIDKHGGRNTYAALIQHALPEGVVLAEQESRDRSVYRVAGLGREVRLTFQPRADSAHFSVALASMASKYLREVLMAEFNAFWQRHVPGLKPTAGYPGDAARFLAAIQPAAQRLGLSETALWRRR